MKEIANGESKIRRVLFNEVSLVIGVIAMAFGVFNMLQTPQTDLAVMKELNNLRDNHLHTLDVKLDEQSDELQQLQQAIVELKTIINERLPR